MGGVEVVEEERERVGARLLAAELEYRRAQNWVDEPGGREAYVAASSELEQAKAEMEQLLCLLAGRRPPGRAGRARRR